MASILKVKEAETMQQQQQVLLKLCFQHVIRGLYMLVRQVGGVALGDQLETAFNETAQSNGYPLRMYTHEIRGLDSPADWLIYRELLAQVVDFATSVSNKATVKKFIQAILEQLQEETGSNLHEAKFRLALMDYTD